MLHMAGWDSLERVFHEEFKYEIVIVILCNYYALYVLTHSVYTALDIMHVCHAGTGKWLLIQVG